MVLAPCLVSGEVTTTRSGLAAPSAWPVVELGHGAFEEVAPVSDVPLVAGLNQHGAGEARQAFASGKTPRTSVRRTTAADSCPAPSRRPHGRRRASSAAPVPTAGRGARSRP